MSCNHDTRFFSDCPHCRLEAVEGKKLSDFTESKGYGMAEPNLPELEDYENGCAELLPVYHLYVELYRKKGYIEDPRFTDIDIGIAGWYVPMYRWLK